MSEFARYRGALRLRERWLCLELCNATIDWHASRHPVEHLQDYCDLVAWGHEVGLIGPGASTALNAIAARQPQRAGAALNRLVALREVCYRTFAEVAHHRTPGAGEIAGLNGFLARSLSAAAVMPAGEGFVWSWQAIDLDWALWPVARSAADLLTSEELDRLGQCADDRGCGWLFIDATRSRRRRWCSMESCGNRAKQRRHLEREKLGRARRDREKP
jgi:predicted RNA-binding Zn ribbon-like protein